jgi:hypothetical protein
MADENMLGYSLLGYNAKYLVGFDLDLSIRYKFPR